MPNYTLNSYQVALFPKDLKTSNIQSLTPLLTGMSEFDGSPIILPLPPDAPREIPQIILRSSDETRQCQISFEKIYLTLTCPKNGTLEETIDEIKDFVLKVLGNIPSGVVYKRFGFITDYLIDDHGEGVLLKVLNSALKPEEVTDFSIIVTKEEKLAAYEKCNRRLSLQKGKKIEAPHEVVTLVQQDFNTSQENEENFDLEKIKVLLDQSYAESTLAKIKSALCLE